MEEADDPPAARRLAVFPSVRSRRFLTTIFIKLRTICVSSLHSVNPPSSPTDLPSPSAFLPPVNADLIFFFFLPLNGPALSPGLSSDRYGSGEGFLACTRLCSTLSSSLCLGFRSPSRPLDGGLGRATGPVLHLARSFR
jgi:hypothetical protein